jgi:Fur family ferric uptake transcriptional regulator
VAVTQNVLDEHGIKATSQRLAVLHALAEEPNDATAQQIHGRLAAGGRRIGLATVYRTLALLNEHGVVDTLSHHPGETCYRVVELADCEIDAWLERASASHGFVATSHRLEATGVCADCG